jgi:tetratricopeptide (TPR) repeat protein
MIRRLSFSCALVLALSCATRAHAEAPREAPVREASAHFQRGVELYNDGDFRGALVEFKRAYGIWPRANVLYDIGQTEFQLLDYAAALKTMERYLAETGPNAVHRAEVEGTVETLRGRVGRIAVGADAADCEVSIDDQPVGTLPLAQPIAVSVGPRKLSVVCPGRPPTVKHVEIAAGETARVELRLRPPAVTQLRVPGPLNSPPPPEPRRVSRTSLGAAWASTALLAAGVIGLGAATLVEQSDLERLKASYPVTNQALDHQANVTLGLSIATDLIGVGALAALGAATWQTIKYHREHALKLGLSGRSVVFKASF